MTDLRSLEQTLSDNLPWNKARIKFVARVLLALFSQRTVNLARLATAFSGAASEAAHYKRLQRFLHHFEVPYAQVARFVIKLLGESGPYTLALDRTNWKIGSLNVNILLLSVVWRDIGFPLVWCVLPHAGNSDTRERITLLEIFIDLFGVPAIQCLLGDREFVGKAWFTFLKTKRIPFQMRLKKDTQVKNGRGQFVPAWRLFTTTRINQVRVVPEARWMWGLELYLSGCKLKHGEWLILVSAAYRDDPAMQYAERWGIETLFGALKTRGFNLEDTRLTDEARLSRLFALLALAFTWAFLVGQWQAVVKKLKLKKHGYPSKSIFRLGLDLLCRLVTNLESRDLLAWNKVIKLLSGI
jgi:Transposase DDE domain